jgi:hypothetical protein
VQHIIGLVGFIGSGKGTAGEILSENGYIRESFAKGVKDVTSAMFGWDREMLEGDTESSRRRREEPDLFWSNRFGRPFTPREALQKMGTEVGRDVFHNDFWVLQLEHRMTKYNNPIVITDVRFPNEIDWIRNQGGKVYEVRRGKQPNWYKFLMATYPEKDINSRWGIMNDYDVHYSEWAWVGCKMDGIIDNNGTLNELTKQIENLIINV